MNTIIGTELGRQLSVKSFGWNRSQILEGLMQDKNSDLFLMRVVGIATGVKAFKSRQKNDEGEQMEGFGITGNFEGTGPNGEVVPGGKVYLPGYITDSLVSALSDDDDVSVNIALDIYARYDETSGTSYVFVGRSLIPQQNDRMDELKRLVSRVEMPKISGPTNKTK